MYSKLVNFQHCYDVPEEFSWIAVNRNGSFVAFHNPPVRDFENCEWIDSTDGSHGELIEFAKWDVSVREVKDLQDLRKSSPGVLKKKMSLEFTKNYVPKKKGSRK